MEKTLRYKLVGAPLIPFTMHFVKQINGLENVPENGKFVVVANHESYIDPPIIKAIFDRNFNVVVHFLTKKEAYNNLFKNFFFESVGTIKVNRGKKDDDAIKLAVKKIKHGFPIGIFPEGTRSKDGNLHRGKTGAVRIALLAKCPIIPVGINNTYELWPPNRKFPKYKKEVVVNIGKPINLSKYHNKKISKKLLRKITDEIMIEISNLSNQKYLFNS